MVSHPVWVRGLKHVGEHNKQVLPLSHPVWVRGLKLMVAKVLLNRKVAPRVGAWIETVHYAHCCKMLIVAPRVGAWIETVNDLQRGGKIYVAPRVGAWIETLSKSLEVGKCKVAPRVGAWIETYIAGVNMFNNLSRTPCGCVD